MTSPADLDLVQRILKETGVDQTPPSPNWSGYLEAVAEAFAAWLRKRVPGLDFLSSLPVSLGPAVALAGVIFVVAVLVVVMRTAVLRRRRAPARPTRPAATGAPRTPDRDRGAWREEIDRRLARGDIEGALEALWWWFARSVSAGRVDPSWTSRELLASCGRSDLTPTAGVLDRLLYGLERPRPEDLRRFVGRLEAALP